MWQQYQSITINGIKHSKAEIQLLASVKVEDKSTIAHEKSFYRFVLEWLNKEDFIIAKTSGSTGVPKEIIIPKNKMVTSALQTALFLNLTEKDQVMLCLSCEHIAGKMMVVRAFVSGFNLIITEPTSIPLSNYLHTPIDFIAIVPTQLFMLLDDEKTKNKLQQIKNVIIGGAEIPFSLKQKIKPFANNIYETFGMTETVSHIAMKLFSKNNEEDFFRTIGSVTVSTNENNCLLIYAPHLQEEIIVTNDVVEIIDSKTFKWLGRLDNVINSGGIKLYAETIEQKIKKVLPQKFFIAGVADEKFGNRVIIVFETKEKINEEALFKLIAPVLEKYELPKQVFTMPQFIETLNGKLNRKATLQLLLQNYFSV
jgi:O-succinylbenzoic acid--CoA ligase